MAIVKGQISDKRIKLTEEEKEKLNKSGRFFHCDKGEITTTSITAKQFKEELKKPIYMSKEEADKHTVKIPELKNICIICDKTYPFKEFIVLQRWGIWTDYLGICKSCLKILRNIIMKEKHLGRME